LTEKPRPHYPINFSNISSLDEKSPLPEIQTALGHIKSSTTRILSTSGAIQGCPKYGPGTPTDHAVYFCNLQTFSHDSENLYSIVPSTLTKIAYFLTN